MPYNFKQGDRVRLSDVHRSNGWTILPHEWLTILRREGGGNCIMYLVRDEGSNVAHISENWIIEKVGGHVPQF